MEVDQTPPGKKDPNAAPDSAQKTAGAIGYACDANGKSRDAYVYARTMLFFQSPASESADQLHRSGRSGAARARHYRHLSETFQVSQKWVQYQNQIDEEGYQYQVAAPNSAWPS